MSHRWLAGLAILTSVLFSGCMSIECVGTGCGDCSDPCGGCGPRPIPRNLCDDMCQVRRSVVCGGGCGEVYYGEWTSTPPDCADPCDPCSGDWVGGCDDKCWPCVRLHSLFSCLVGKRLHCDDSRDVFDICSICNREPCATGCDTCSSCGGEEIYDDGDSIISDDGVYSEVVDGSMSHTTASQFKPMPRMASSSTRIASHPKSCNCGKH